MAEEGNFLAAHLLGSIDDTIKDVQNYPLS